MSELEETLAGQLRMLKVPTPVREHPFAKSAGRKFRFDFAWPDHMLAAECEGGIWTNGAHTRGKHFEQDAEKYNLATDMGYRVYRFTEKHVNDWSAAETIKRAILGQNPRPENTVALVQGRESLKAPCMRPRWPRTNRNNSPAKSHAISCWPSSPPSRRPKSPMPKA